MLSSSHKDVIQNKNMKLYKWKNPVIKKGLSCSSCANCHISNVCYHPNVKCLPHWSSYLKLVITHLPNVPR